ncbi:MAG: hypothetical protein FWC15_07505 [Fibromonadales bacterium]|nr:hypothetical protein [Fibromonadales bacterium]
MLKFYLIFAVFALISCGETKSEKAVIESAVDSYGAIIENAKDTEAVLQKKADSIARQAESLGIPR